MRKFINLSKSLHSNIFEYLLFKELRYIKKKIANRKILDLVITTTYR